MKLILATLLILSAVPAEAKPGRYNSRSGWASEQKCFRKEYREEYVPGTAKNPGYVKSFYKKVRIPCERPQFMPQSSSDSFPRYEHSDSNMGNVDNNSCIEGTISGGLLGGAAGGVLAKKENWIWSIPTGIVSGAMIGCQVDGG